MTENLEFSSHNYSAIPKAENRTRKHWKAYLATTKHPPHIFFPGNAVKLVVKGFWFYGGIKKLSPFDHLAPRPNHQLRYSLLKLTTPMFTAINPSIYMYIYTYICQKITHITASDSPVLYCYDA